MCEQASPTFPSEILEGLQSNDAMKQLVATQSVRKLLSREKHPPIEGVIGAGIVPRLVEFLSNNSR